jgi:hypothetical protein
MRLWVRREQIILKGQESGCSRVRRERKGGRAKKPVLWLLHQRFKSFFKYPWRSHPSKLITGGDRIRFTSSKNCSQLKEGK